MSITAYSQRFAAPVVWSARGTPSSILPFPSLAEARGGGAPGGASLNQHALRGVTRANDACALASRRSTAAFSLRRRAALSSGSRGHAQRTAVGPNVSLLQAGGHSTPGRSPAAARDGACEAPARAPHRPKTGNCPVPATGLDAASPTPPPVRPAVTTPHESAPRRTGRPPCGLIPKYGVDSTRPKC